MCYHLATDFVLFVNQIFLLYLSNAHDVFIAEANVVEKLKIFNKVSHIKLRCMLQLNYIRHTLLHETQSVF